MEANVTKVLRSTAIDCRFRMLEAFLTQTRHERGSVAVSDTAHFLSAAIWTRPSGHASSFLFLFFFSFEISFNNKNCHTRFDFSVFTVLLPSCLRNHDPLVSFELQPASVYRPSPASSNHHAIIDVVHRSCRHITTRAVVALLTT